MMRRINAAGDRLLGLLVPRVNASADPCGQEYYQHCYCAPNLRAFRRFCCSNGGCGSCYASGWCL